MSNIVWVSPQRHRSVSVSRHFLLQAPMCPCAMWKRISRDHCCRGRLKHSCRIVGSHPRWELITWADFQLCHHRLLMSTGCKSNADQWCLMTLTSSTTSFSLPKHNQCYVMFFNHCCHPLSSSFCYSLSSSSFSYFYLSLLLTVIEILIKFQESRLTVFSTQTNVIKITVPQNGGHFGRRAAVGQRNTPLNPYVAVSHAQ